MTTEAIFHIYVNNKCVKASLNEEDFKREMSHIQAFLELTHLDQSAKVEYVHGANPPQLALADGSY